jgi:hypothetical protein
MLGRAAGIHRLIWTLPSEDMPIAYLSGNALRVRVAGAIADPNVHEAA